MRLVAPLQFMKIKILKRLLATVCGLAAFFFFFSKTALAACPTNYANTATSAYSDGNDVVFTLSYGGMGPVTELGLNLGGGNFADNNCRYYATRVRADCNTKFKSQQCIWTLTCRTSSWYGNATASFFWSGSGGCSIPTANYSVWCNPNFCTTSCAYPPGKVCGQQYCTNRCGNTVAGTCGAVNSTTCSVTYCTCTRTGTKTCVSGNWGTCSATDPRATCASTNNCGATCGTATCSDGCGGTLTCTAGANTRSCTKTFGTCSASGTESCVGGAWSGVCNATDPRATCTSTGNCGKTCGTNTCSDGCGGTLTCTAGPTFRSCTKTLGPAASLVRSFASGEPGVLIVLFLKTLGPPVPAPVIVAPLAAPAPVLMDVEEL